MDFKEAILKYGELYKSQFANGYVVWRPISHKEYFNTKRLGESKILSQIEQEDYVWESCVVFSTYLTQDELEIIHVRPDFTKNTLTAGIVATVSRQILYFTGFDPDADIFLAKMGEARDSVSSNVIELSKAAVMKVFPAYKLDSFDDMTFPQLCKLTALVENVSDYNIQIKGQEDLQNKGGDIPAPAELKDRQLPSAELNEQGGRGRHGRKHLGMDSTLHNDLIEQATGELAARYNDPRMASWAQANIPSITKEDMYPEKQFVNTGQENRRLLSEKPPLDPDYKKEHGIEW